MRLVHLTDLHVTAGRDLEDQRLTLRAIVTAAEKCRPDGWLITGDLYGVAVPHAPTPMEREVLEPELVRMARWGPVVILTGNHDHARSLARLEDLGGTHPIRVISGAKRFRMGTPAGPVDIYALAYPTTTWLLRDEPRPPSVTEARTVVAHKLAALFRAWGMSLSRARAQSPRVPQVFLGHFQVAGATITGGEVIGPHDIEIGRAALEGLRVDYGALGHIHQRQQLSPRWWYAGSPWPMSYAETEAKGWHLVALGEDLPRRPQPESRTHHVDGADLVPTVVGFYRSGARAVRTLHYRWAADRADGEPHWVVHPFSGREPEAELQDVKVRARLVVPDQWLASCPWSDVLQQLREMGAHRVDPEVIVEPTHRVRAPEVAIATTFEGKLTAWAQTLESPPEPLDMEAAQIALAKLQEMTDEDMLLWLESEIQACTETNTTAQVTP